MTEADAPKVQTTTLSPRVKEHALRLFNHMIAVNPNLSSNPRMAMLKAVRAAVDSQEMLESIESGDTRIHPEAVRQEKVTVTLWQLNSGANGFDVMTDDGKPNGKPVTIQALADPFAYAPNLPAEHPANSRFKPVDGISFEERVRQFKSDVNPERRSLRLDLQPPVTVN